MKTDIELKAEIAAWERNVATSRRMKAYYEQHAEKARQQVAAMENMVKTYSHQIHTEESAMRTAHWELTTGHRAEKHDGCERTHCMICEGGLTHCVRCGGFEGSLLPTCPGKQLTQAEHDANYAHYCAGTGPYAEEHKSVLERA